MMFVDACTLVILIISQLLNGNTVTAILLILWNQLAVAGFIYQLLFSEALVILYKFVC
jgi:hypothetical protein